MSALLQSPFAEQLAGCEVIEKTHWRPEMRLGEVVLKNGEIMQCVFVREADIKQNNDGFNLPWVPLAAGHIAQIRRSKYAVPESIQLRMNVMKARGWSGEVSLGMKMRDGKIVGVKGSLRDMWCFASLPSGYEWEMVDELLDASNSDVECEQVQTAVCLI